MNEIQVIGEIKQGLIVEYNKENIELFMDYVRNKFKDIVVTEESRSEIQAMIPKINKALSQFKDRRKETVKKALEPLNQFEEDFKGYEKELEGLYRSIKDQIDEMDRKELEKQKAIIKQIFDEEVANMELTEIKSFLSLPKQTGELSKGNFTEKKAKKVIIQMLEKVDKNKDAIDELINRINKDHSISIDPTNHYQYINEDFIDISKGIHKEKLEQIELRKKMKESIKEEVKKEIEEVKAVTPKRKKGINLIINTSDLALEVAKELKAFLDSRNIKYIKEEIGE